MLKAILDHLNAALPEGRWSGVHIAEDVDQFSEVAGRLDDASAILMPWGEKADRQALMSGGFRQRVSTVFAVGIVLRDYSGSMGDVRALRFDILKADIETALAGWSPDGAADGCELIAGEASPVTKGVSIYVQTWGTARFLTGALQ